MRPLDFRPDPKRRKHLMGLIRQAVADKRQLAAAMACSMLRLGQYAPTRLRWIVATKASYRRAYSVLMEVASDRT